MSVTCSNVKSYIHVETSLIKEKKNDKLNKRNLHEDFNTVNSSQLLVSGYSLLVFVEAVITAVAWLLAKIANFN